MKTSRMFHNSVNFHLNQLKLWISQLQDGGVIQDGATV
jgi:hypothetical protein